MRTSKLTRVTKLLIQFIFSFFSDANDSSTTTKRPLTSSELPTSSGLGSVKSSDVPTASGVRSIKSHLPSSSLQEGAGSHLAENSSLVHTLAEAVLKQIESRANTAITPRWRNYERAEPTEAVEILTNTLPPQSFSNPIVATDMNDSFDEQALLKKVPKPFKKNAASLLKEFDQRPNELTWDANGNVYIDEQVVPNCTIYVPFPSLFHKKVSKKVSGMPDFLAKIQSMGLSHLI